MASLLARATQKIFGLNGGTSEFGKIGSQSAGSPVTTKDLATIQSLTQFLEGLYSITNNAAQPPFIEDLNALYYLITTQLAYLFQSGIPEYDPDTNYFNLISYVQVSGVIYQSINGTDPSPNIGNTPASSPTKWRKLIDVDGTLAANSDLVVASQKATKTYADTALALKAPLASPALTGNPTAPTQSPGNNTTRLANTAFVAAADALLAPKASPTFTGTVVVPVAADATSPTQKTYVDAADALLAPKASPTFTGTVVVPAAAGATSPYQKGEVDTALALKAPLASPALTGIPTISGNKALAFDNFQSYSNAGATINLPSMEVGELATLYILNLGSSSAINAPNDGVSASYKVIPFNVIGSTGTNPLSIVPSTRGPGVFIGNSNSGMTFTGVIIRVS